MDVSPVGCLLLGLDSDQDHENCRVDISVGWSRVDELGSVTSLEVHELLSRMRMKISETRR